MSGTVGLAELRRVFGLTQAQVGASMGVSQQRVHDIEAVPVEQLTLPVLERYVRALGGGLRIQVVFPDGEKVELP